MKVLLQCKEDEDIFNDACYKKCPEGFTDAKLYCEKSEYVERFVSEIKETQLKENEEIYGDKWVVQKCESFGEYFKPLGIKYCRQVCPEGW